MPQEKPHLQRSPDALHPPLHMTPDKAQASAQEAPAGLENLAGGANALAPSHSIGSLLILLSVPCVLPVPGIGNVMGLALIGVAGLIWRIGSAGAIGRPGLVGSLRLHHDHEARLLQWLSRVEQWSGRWCRPRLNRLTQLPARSWQAASAAAVVAMLGVEIFLPIPLGNVLPAAALTLMGMALKHRDGVVALWSLVLASLALAYPFLLGLGAWQWIMAPLWRAWGMGG